MHEKGLDRLSLVMHCHDNWFGIRLEWNDNEGNTLPKSPAFSVVVESMTARVAVGRYVHSFLFVDSRSGDSLDHPVPRINIVTIDGESLSQALL